MSRNVAQLRKPAASRPWYEIRAAAAERKATLWLYGFIGEDLFGEGVAAKELVRALATLDVDRIDVRVNSEGGSVFDGMAIYNALREHPAEVVAQIDYLAASIAAVIPLAADRVLMADNGLFMIHEAFGGMIGRAADMRRFADLLDVVNGGQLDAFERKTGRDREELAAAMAAETWYSAAEALEVGFIDEIAAPVRMAATARFNLEAVGIRHAPAELAERKIRDAGDGAASDSEDTPAGAAEAPAAAAAEAAPVRARVFVPGVGFRQLSREDNSHA